jgi:hypothetical protein
MSHHELTSAVTSTSPVNLASSLWTITSRFARARPSLGLERSADANPLAATPSPAIPPEPVIRSAARLFIATADWGSIARARRYAASAS